MQICKVINQSHCQKSMFRPKNIPAWKQSKGLHWCCLRYRWDDEIQSRKLSWSYRWMCLKVCQMPKHHTDEILQLWKVITAATVLSLVTRETVECEELESNPPGMWACVYIFYAELMSVWTPPNSCHNCNKALRNLALPLPVLRIMSSKRQQAC